MGLRELRILKTLSRAPVAVFLGFVVQYVHQFYSCSPAREARFSGKIGGQARDTLPSPRAPLIPPLCLFAFIFP